MSVLSKVACTLCALLPLALPQAALGQAYPTKPIRLILPFPPGGPTDIAGRIIGQKLAEQLGQPVIPDNRPGATSNVGMELTARAPADGYTIVFAGPPLAVSPSL